MGFDSIWFDSLQAQLKFKRGENKNPNLHGNRDESEDELAEMIGLTRMISSIEEKSRVEREIKTLDSWDPEDNGEGKKEREIEEEDKASAFLFLFSARGLYWLSL